MASPRLDQFGPDLLAHTIDQDLDDIRVAIAVMAIDVFGQFGLRYDVAGVQHEISEESIFERRQIEGGFIAGDAL